MQTYICSNCGKSFDASPDGGGMIVCAFCGWEMEAKTAEIPLSPGTRIEGYEILRHLGSGGTGDVYLAEQYLMERKVALKLLKKEGLSPAEVEHFFEEARKTAMFDDPHMISVLDMGTSQDGYCYLATRYVEGDTLEDLLIREQNFDPLRSLKIILEVACGLSNVWNRTSMFHRDIKPGNIMLTVSGEVMILDMGIAQTYGENSLVNGEVEGSPYYMSPEQARGEKLSWSTDLYSLGVTLYQMLTGVLPYDAPTLGEILEMHNSKPFPAIAERAPHAKVPPEVEELLKRMMGKTPAERFASWNEFLAAAKELFRKLEALPSPERTPDLPQKTVSLSFREGQTHCRTSFRRQIWLMTFLAVLLVSVLCAGFFLYLAGKKNSYYADKCLLEAAEIVQNKGWKASELEEVLNEFRPVIKRFGVNPSVRRRFSIYQKEAQDRASLEKSEQKSLDQLELQTARLLEEIRKDLEFCRYNPVLNGGNGKFAAYSKVIRKVNAFRNDLSRTVITLPDNLKRKRVLAVRLYVAVTAVYRESRQLCGVPESSRKRIAARQRKKPPVRSDAGKKNVSASAVGRTGAKKPSVVSVRKEKKPSAVRPVRHIRKEVPQAKQKVLVLKPHQKAYLEKLFEIPEDTFFADERASWKKIRIRRDADAHFRSLVRSLLRQSNAFYNRIYNSGRKFTDEKLRVGSLNRVLKIWTIRKHRIYFRNEPVVQTFSQIYSGDWYDFLKRIAAKEKAQEEFEAYLLFTKNYIVLDEKKMRNARAKRLLPGVKALRSEIRTRHQK